MTPERKKAFFRRLRALAALEIVCEEALALDLPEGRVLEAVRVARMHGDEKSLAELDAVARRVLDRHALPAETEQGVAMPARTLRAAERARLIAWCMKNARDQVVEGLRRYWPTASADEGAVMRAIELGHSLEQVLRAWGVDRRSAASAARALRADRNK